MYLQKVISKNNVIGIWKVIDEKSRIRIRIRLLEVRIRGSGFGSVPKCYESGKLVIADTVTCKAYMVIFYI
jgi:hypothetical protein